MVKKECFVRFQVMFLGSITLSYEFIDEIGSIIAKFFRSELGLNGSKTDLENKSTRDAITYQIPCRFGICASFKHGDYGRHIMKNIFSHIHDL